MQLWIVEHFHLHKKVPVVMNHNLRFFQMLWFISTGTLLWRWSVQLFRVAFFRMDFFQNPYFSVMQSEIASWFVHMIQNLILNRSSVQNCFFWDRFSGKNPIQYHAHTITILNLIFECHNYILLANYKYIASNFWF